MAASDSAPRRGLHGRDLLPDPWDLLLALALLALDIGQLWAAHERARIFTVPLAMLPLAYRRRWPLQIFPLVVLGVVFSASEHVFWAPMVALILVTYAIGAYTRRRFVALAVLLATGTAVLLTFGGQLPPLPEFVGPYLILVTPWLVGTAIRGQQEQTAALRDRAAQLERGRALSTQAALADERARIARELHDVVAHSVSIMVVQAGAARHVLRTAPGQAEDALRAVETTGREAMAELRQLLGLLSPAEGAGGLAPQPGMDQVDALIRRVGEAGLRVALHIAGPRRALPAAIDLTAYRIVQEALTNALKYAGQAPTEVVLDYRPAELKIEIVDAGPGAGAPGGTAPGHGLAGMRERVALFGGTLEAGPRLDGGYAVRAWLPLEPAGQDAAA